MAIHPDNRFLTGDPDVARGARVVLGDLLNDAGELCPPDVLIEKLTAHTFQPIGDQEHDSLARLSALGRAYALRVLVDGSANQATYFRAIREFVGIVRQDADPSTWILRALFARKTSTKEEKSRARVMYNSYATAIAHLARSGIPPDQVTKVGRQTGQGISQWAIQGRLLRNSARNQSEKRDAQGRPKKLFVKPISSLVGTRLKAGGDRALIEVELAKTGSTRVYVKRAASLPLLSGSNERGQRWQQIRELIEAKSLSDESCDSGTGEKRPPSGQASARDNKRLRKQFDIAEIPVETTKHKRGKDLVAAYSSMLERLNANFFVTFNFGYLVNPETAAANIESFCAKLERRALGKDWLERGDTTGLTMVAFGEHMESNPHWHAMARLSKSLGRTIRKKGKRLWSTIAPRGQLDLKYPIKSQKAVITYCLKYLLKGHNRDCVIIYKAKPQK